MDSLDRIFNNETVPRRFADSPIPTGPLVCIVHRTRYLRLRTPRVSRWALPCICLPGYASHVLQPHALAARVTRPPHAKRGPDYVPADTGDFISVEMRLGQQGAVQVSGRPWDVRRCVGSIGRDPATEISPKETRFPSPNATQNTSFAPRPFPRPMVGQFQNSACLNMRGEQMQRHAVNVLVDQHGINISILAASYLAPANSQHRGLCPGKLLERLLGRDRIPAETKFRG